MPDNTQHDAVIAKIITRLDNVENNNKTQWRKIDKIYVVTIGALSGIVLVLLTLTGNLLLMLAKG